MPSRDIFERYPPDVIGFDQWNRLLKRLFEFRQERETEEVKAQLRVFFTEFIDAASNMSPAKSACRVFVSHQRKDVGYAATIAYMACRHDFEYWLDVHDPVLRFANTAGLPAMIEAILIAAIIEMNLLNCSHICTVQTQRAKKSRWVPYEFGRAKARRLRSEQAASWFDNGVYPATVEYLLLGHCLRSTSDVTNWLARESSSGGCDRTASAWPAQNTRPNPLPN